MSDSSEASVHSTGTSHESVAESPVQPQVIERGRRGRPSKRRGSSAPRRGAKRGRGVSRGKTRRESVDDRERRQGDIEHIIGQREKLVEEMIREMGEEETKEVLIEIYQEEPSLVQKVLKKKRTAQADAPCPPSSHEGPVPPAWCVCTRCREMPTERERACCGYRAEDCESQLPNFQLVCLDPEVLRVAQIYRRDFLANAPDRDLNREKRHTGYRQYILWKHGRLGEGVRLVIPSCCVWAIRDRYPDAHGFYVGFLDYRVDV